jgi:hypothetical protein
MSQVDFHNPTDDAKGALLELARLLGRVAADEAVYPSTPGTSPPPSQKKGACDDKQ